MTTTNVRTADDRDLDWALVKRAQAGDQRAFSELVTRYQRKVYTIALGLLRSPEDAMDVAQEAFVKVFKYLAHFKGEASFYTWMYRITVNICVDRRRRKGGDPKEQVEFDESAETQMENSPGIVASKLGTDPQANILRQELSTKIEEALQQVPEKHRAILLLREIDGLSYEEIATALEIPKGTVMSRLFHARKKLQGILAGYEGE